MRVVSSSSLLFTSLVASSLSLPSLAAPVRARKDSIYERQEMGSPLPAAFESSASTSNLVGLVAPPTTPAFGERDNVLGGLGDFKHEFEGVINALEVSASPAPAPTQSKKLFPSSLSKLSQSTTLAPSGVTSSSAASSTSASAIPSASASILPRGDSFFEGLIGALSAPAPPSSSGMPSTASVQSLLARNGYSGGMLDGLMRCGYYNAGMATASAAASPTPSLDARGADDVLDELIGALGVLGGHAHSTTSSQTTSSPALPMTSPTLGTRDGMLDGLIGALDVSTTTNAKLSGLGIMSGTLSSATATGVPMQATT